MKHTCRVTNSATHTHEVTHTVIYTHGHEESHTGTYTQSQFHSPVKHTLWNTRNAAAQLQSRQILCKLINELFNTESLLGCGGSSRWLWSHHTPPTLLHFWLSSAWTRPSRALKIWRSKRKSSTGHWRAAARSPSSGWVKLSTSSHA